LVELGGKMKQYNKLVRDKIPEIIANNGELPVYRTLSDKEYKIELDKKLKEEVEEYLEDDNIEELADIMEVLDAILEAENISIEKLEKVKSKKREERGNFQKKIFLEKVIEKGDK